MPGIGDVVFCLLKCSEDELLKIGGRLVEVKGSTVVVATLKKAAEKTPYSLQTKVPDSSVDLYFVRVPGSSVSVDRPSGWSDQLVAQLPSAKACSAAWAELGSEVLVSSGAEQLPPVPTRGKALGSLSEQLQGMQAMWGSEEGSEDSSSEEEVVRPGKAKTKHLPPGGSSSKVEEKKSRSSKETNSMEAMLQQLMSQGMSEVKSPTELMPYMMMNLMLQQNSKRSSKKRQKRRSSSLGGSSSDSSSGSTSSEGRGMKAVSSLHKMHQRILKRPKKVCREFEAEVIREMGIVEGQPWTLTDWVKKQSWNKYKGLYRCAIMDVAAYELIRAGKVEAGAAQLVQNLKAKLESVLQQGDWNTAWLLTGLSDPLQKKEFAGSKQEMSIISNYVNSLGKLRKHVKEAKGQAVAGEEEEDGATHKHNFPCALPYPEVLSPVGDEIVEGEAGAALWAKRHLNVLVAWCNFVVLGCPDCSGWADEPQTAYRCCADARVFADKLLGEVEEFGSLEVRENLLTFKGGRRAVEKAVADAGLLASGYGCAAGGIASSGAIAVVPERVAVPPSAGTVDPCAFLPQDRREVVENLSDLRLPEHLWPKIPRACHRVARSDEARLVKKLLDHKMVVLVPEQDLPCDAQGKFLSGGFFCVPKNESEDRLIFDRRPENATMSRVIWAELPAGACFSRMLLKPCEYLRASGDDLRNFYYALSLPQNWIKYNSVGRRVDPSLVSEYGGDATLPHRMCLRVMGMGDCNSCDIAQATHESILQAAGLLDEGTQLKYGRPLPAGDIFDGVYLDDLLVACRCQCSEPVPVDGSFEPPAPQASDPDMVRVRNAEEAYQAAGLQRAEHKAFRAEVAFKAWGAEVDGVKGFVAAPLDMRRQTWVLLQRVVELGFCSKEIFQKLLGYLCFIFQYKRECFSLQHHVYKYVSKMPADRWVRLPPHILDELRSMAYHIPLATWNMRKTLSNSLLATDATPTSGGAARAPVSEALAEELWRVSEVKGEPVRLDESAQQQLFSHWDDPKEPSMIASILGRCLHWTATSSYTFRETSHINLQEARALRKEVAHLAKDPANQGSIQLCLNDSRVVCGAVSKGRSSSFKLNGILRGMLPYLIFGQICLGLIWIETEANPADYPSRMKLIPPPSLRPPPWLARYLESNLKIGWEIFAGSCRLTKAHTDFGFSMRMPIEILLGSDAFDEMIDDVIRGKGVAWIWLAPPCCSFSPLRNWDIGGPLRPKGRPEGDESNPEVWLGNRLWRRALQLAFLCADHGIFFFLEHPRNSRAWSMKETQKLWSIPGIKSHVVHWCAYDDPSRNGPPTQKPTRILSTAPWLSSVVAQCPGNHEHGPPLRGARAKAAGAYPWGFCCALARACIQWLERGVDEAYSRGERLYWTTLGVLAVQRAFHLSAPLLRGTWSAIKGWRMMKPPRSRVPITWYRLECLLVVGLSQAWAHRGFLRRRWLSAVLGWWIAFVGLLRPGELLNLRIGDISLPENSGEDDQQLGVTMPSSRLSSALRELASALEEADLENSGGFELLSASAPSPTAASSRAAEAKAKRKSKKEVLERPEGFNAIAGGSQEVRHYIVLKNPTGSGARLRRVDNKILPGAKADPNPAGGGGDVASVIGKAADEFAQVEVEPGVSMAQALTDPAMRASAARWRPSTESRKVTALFARLLNGLQQIRPGWLSNMRAPTLQAVEPLPLRAQTVEQDTTSWLQLTWKFGRRLLSLRWRTLLLLALVILLPRIFALAVTSIIRLLVRAMLALLARVGVELGRELHHLVLQLNLATFHVESALLDYVSEMFGFGSEPQPPLMASPPVDQPIPLRYDAQQCPFPSTTSPPPWALFHSLLLVADMLLRARQLGGAGVP
eukprot:Skav218054  [mRNA]  locus=scaffold214:1429603:1436014:- [translate_table: standard]